MTRAEREDFAVKLLGILRALVADRAKPVPWVKVPRPEQTW